MKKFVSILAICASAYLGYSQTTDTNTIPDKTYGTVLGFMSGGGSNWLVAPYGIYNSGAKSLGESFGGGIALAYQLTDVLEPALRIDYIDKDVFLFNGSCQLEMPTKWLDNFFARPFGVVGAAIPFSGLKDGNGAAIGIFGAGVSLHVTEKIYVLTDAEYWLGGKFNNMQYRLGVGFRF